MTEPTTLTRAPSHRSDWKWFLALGAVLLVLGTAAIGSATMLELTSLLVFGPLLLTSSAMQLITAFMAEKTKESLLHYAAAVLEAFLGFFVMAHPFENVISLIAVIALLFLVIGLVRLARSLAARSRARAAAILTGGVALLLGISLWVGGTEGAFWFVGLCIGLDLLWNGVSWLAVAVTEWRGSCPPPC